MPNGMSERSVLIEHCGVGGSVRKDTLYPIAGCDLQLECSDRSETPVCGADVFFYRRNRLPL